MFLASEAKQLGPVRWTTDRESLHADGGANYGRFMAGKSGEDNAVVAKTAAMVASRLDDRLGETTRSIQELLVREIPELGGDAQLLQLLRDTVAANVDTYFSAIRYNIPVKDVEVPTTALEHARRLAQRDVSANALVRAYRLGHRVALKIVLEEIRAAKLEPQLSLDVYEQMSAIMFGYIDQTSQQVVATYQGERERWLENRNSLRTLRIREILAGAGAGAGACRCRCRRRCDDNRNPLPAQTNPSGSHRLV